MTREDLPTCQYWEGCNNEQGGCECGEPAIAVWIDEDGKGRIYACREHDRLIEAREEGEPL